MAKIVGPLHSDFASGSVGNVVYKRNQYGFYCYEKPAFVDAPTAAQTTWRDVFKDVAADWDDPDNITARNRDMWFAFSRNFNSSTRFGRDIRCSARQWFIKLNCLRYAAGYSINHVPPKDPSGTFNPLFSISQTIAGIILESSIWPDVNQLLHVSYVPEQSTNRNFCPRTEQFLAFVKNTSDNPFLLVSNSDIPEDLVRYFFVIRSVDVYGRFSSRQVFFFDASHITPEPITVFSNHSNSLYSHVPNNNYGDSGFYYWGYLGWVNSYVRPLLFFDLSLYKNLKFLLHPDLLKHHLQYTIPS
jgi:hypothetical protein